MSGKEYGGSRKCIMTVISGGTIHGIGIGIQDLNIMDKNDDLRGRDISGEYTGFTASGGIGIFSVGGVKLKNGEEKNRNKYSKCRYW